MAQELEKLIKKAHDKITRTKGSEYAPTSIEIENEINKSFTAVEWFYKNLIVYMNGNGDFESAQDIYKQAKAMEKNSYICSNCKCKIDEKDLYEMSNSKGDI